MADIKITLSQNKTVYSGDIDLENKFLRVEKSLWYPLCKGEPKNVDGGDWVYFILNSQVAGRAEIAKKEPPEDATLKTYRNKKISKNRWGIRINHDKKRDTIEKPNKKISYRGFQGFRYLTHSDSKLFKEAFE